MNEVVIQEFYPVHVGYVFNPFHEEIEKELTDHCLELQKTIKKGGDNWIANKTFNSCDTYNILKDEKFNRLNLWVNKKINEFKSLLNIKCNLERGVGWFNIYKKYDFQEFHTHRPYILSCNYFLCSNKEDSKLFFKHDRELLEYSELGGARWHAPLPGKLVIFSSYTDHSVERSELDDLRITLSYNYGK